MNCNALKDIISFDDSIICRSSIILKLINLCNQNYENSETFKTFGINLYQMYELKHFTYHYSKYIFPLLNVGLNNELLFITSDGLNFSFEKINCYALFNKGIFRYIEATEQIQYDLLNTLTKYYCTRLSIKQFELNILSELDRDDFHNILSALSCS